MNQRQIRLFCEKIDYQNGQIFEDGSRCHLWKATISKGGYGQIRVDCKLQYSHRLAWEIENGPIINGLYVLHRCDNRSCVNVKHLFLGTFYENMADMVSKNRQAHGSRNARAKLTEKDVRLIRSLAGTQEEIANKYGVSRSLISMVKAGKIWRLC